MSIGKSGATKKARPRGARKHVAAREALGAAGGAAAGAVIGAVVGPPGAIAGAVLGAAIGAAAEKAVDEGEADKAANDAELDAEIGVMGGDIGAPNLAHPPPTTHRGYSVASSGASPTSGRTCAEGPIPAPDEEE